MLPSIEFIKYLVTFSRTWHNQKRTEERRICQRSTTDSWNGMKLLSAPAGFLFVFLNILATKHETRNNWFWVEQKMFVWMELKLKNKCNAPDAVRSMRIFGGQLISDNAFRMAVLRIVQSVESAKKITVRLRAHHIYASNYSWHLNSPHCICDRHSFSWVKAYFGDFIRLYQFSTEPIQNGLLFYARRSSSSTKSSRRIWFW